MIIIKKYLYQEKNNHCNLSEINKAYLTTVEALNKETNEFFDLSGEEIWDIVEKSLTNKELGKYIPLEND